MQGLIGLWNHIAQHQTRSKPFKLTVKPVGTDRVQMGEFLTMRTEEIDAFMDGLYHGVEDLLVPAALHAQIDLLHENLGLFSASLSMLSDESIPATERDIKGLERQFRELDLMAATQINDIIQACRRWRQEWTASRGRTMH